MYEHAHLQTPRIHFLSRHSWRAIFCPITALVFASALQAADVDERRMAQLIRQLGSPSYLEREAASDRLREIGEPALEPLSVAAAKSDDAEIRFRAMLLVEGIESRMFAPQRRFVGHKDSVYSLAFSPDDKLLLSAGGLKEDFVLKLWEVASGEEVRSFRGHTAWICGAAFSADGSRIVSGSADLTVRLWDTMSGRELKRFQGHETQITGVAFFRDGRHLLSGSGHWNARATKDASLRLWDLEGDKESGRLPLSPEYGALCVALSTDGRLALAGGMDGNLQLWDVQAGRAAWSVKSKGVRSVAFSPDGRHALTGNYDSALRLWDVKTGESVRTFHGHRGCVAGVSFTPDGKSIVSGGFEDRTVRLWDVASGREIRRYEGHTNNVHAVTVSHDGRFAASSGYDKTILLWRLRHSIANPPMSGGK